MNDRNNETQRLTEKEEAYLKYLDECLASCTCGKTLWKLYAMTPPNGRFTLQVMDGSPNNTILDSLSFRKDDEEERKAGEGRLGILIGKIYRLHGQDYPYPRISSELTYGFHIEYTVRVYVEKKGDLRRAGKPDPDMVLCESDESFTGRKSQKEQRKR